MNVGENIKRLRKSIGWSQAELGRQSGVTNVALSKIEQGDRNPSLKVSKKIALALNISIDELAGDIFCYSLSEAQTFFRKFRCINQLTKEDQALILSLVGRLKSGEESK